MRTRLRGSSSERSEPRGIALILVLLLMLVLSTLAATLVFTARSETFASYSYRLDTEVDYVAKAGIQAGIDWFRSSHYQPVQNPAAASWYNVTPDGSVFNLYTSNTSPVQCIYPGNPRCPNRFGPTQLIGYGGGVSNYPDMNNTLSPAVEVNDDFAANLKNVPVKDASGNLLGVFCVNAYLLSYQTVNCLSCTPTLQPMETWLITSRGLWGVNSCTNTSLLSPVATAEEQAIVQPIYTPSWSNALYGYCSVQMSGSAGDCTDAFNSALGPYGGGNPSVASGGCNSASTTNVISSGAGVGAGGYVSLGSNVTVSGNVGIGNVGYTPPSTCCTATTTPACGYAGGGTVLGSVVNTTFPPVPGVPTFPPAPYPAGPPLAAAAPSFSSGVNLPQVTSGGASPPPNTTINPGASSGYAYPCTTVGICNGSQTNPYLINNATLSSSATITLTGGPDIAHPAYYDLDVLNLSGMAQMTVYGYLVLNVRSSLNLTGQGILNPLTVQPEALQINVACSGSCVTIGGNGGTSSIITAPLATVTMGGGGAGGYLVGAVRAANVIDLGHYAVHYDLQLNRLDGTLAQTVVTSYTRIKQ